MKKNKTDLRELIFASLLLSMAAVLSFVESSFPPLPFLPAGVKLGSSNIIVMYSLFFMGNKWGFSVAFLKSLFVLLLRGPVSFAISLCGGIFSCLALIGLKRQSGLSLLFVSIGAAVAHNIGQLFCAGLILKNTGLFYYLPVLIISGCVMGGITGVTSKIIMPKLQFLKGHFK